MRQHPVPELGLRARYHVVGFGQLLKVIGARQEGVMIKLLVPDLHHVQDHLRVLGIVLVPAIVQSLPGSGEGHGGHQLYVEAGAAEVISLGPVVITRRFKSHADWVPIFCDCRNQSVEVVQLVQHGQTTPARLAGHGNQHLMTRFRNVDGHQNGLGLCNSRIGHSRSPLRCGLLQNHCRDLRPGYDHLLHNLKAAQAVIASQSATFRRCYGKEFTDRLFGLRQRAESGKHEFDSLCTKLDIDHRLTPPRSPQTNGMVERFNGHIEDVLQSRRFRSGEELEATLHRYAWLYNQQLPQSALGSRTPLQAMKD
jgi:hypothetical protein